MSFIALFGRFLYSKSTTSESLHRDLWRVGRGLHGHTCLVASRSVLAHDICTRRSPEPVLVRPPSTTTLENLKSALQFSVGLSYSFYILHTSSFIDKLKIDRSLFPADFQSFLNFAIQKGFDCLCQIINFEESEHSLFIDHYTQKLHFIFIDFQPFCRVFDFFANKHLEL